MSGIQGETKIGSFQVQLQGEPLMQPPIRAKDTFD